MLLSIVTGLVIGLLGWALTGNPLWLVVGIVVGSAWHLHRRVGGLEARLARLEAGTGAATEPVAAAGTDTVADREPEAAPTAHEPDRVPPDATGDHAQDLPDPTASPDPGSEASSFDEGAGEWRAAPGPRVAAFLERIRALVFGGNTLVRLGAALLLIGIAFLVRWMADAGLLPAAVRLGGIGAAGIVLTALGWRFRQREGAYGLVLQGTGVAVLYLCIFAAMKLYGLVDAGPAFAALVLLVVLATALALLQDALALALFATVGGFAAPLATSTGSGDFAALFAYYLLLDIAVLAIARFRTWRSLNWFAFAATFAMAALWALEGYPAMGYPLAQFYVAAFFVLFLAVPILFAHTSTRLRGASGVADGSLLFGMPAVAFAIQAGLVQDFEYGVALSALMAGLVYAALAGTLWRRRALGFGLVAESHLALAVVFATVTIPFAVDDGRVTGAAWALEGVGLVWLGQRQGRRLPVAAGLLLQPLALLAWLAGGLGDAPADVPFLNAQVLSTLMLGLGGLGCARFLERPGERPPVLAWLALLWGAGFWLGAGLEEAARVVGDDAAVSLQALWLGGSMLACRPWLAHWCTGRALVAAGFPLLALLMLGALAEGPPGEEIWLQPMALGWPLAWAAALVALPAPKVLRGDPGGRGLVVAAHGTGGVLAALLPAWAIAGAVDAIGGVASSWALLPWGLACAFAAAWLAGRSPERLPVRLEPEAWGRVAPLVLAAVALGWILFAAVQPGSAAPLPWLVLLNPIELGQWLVLIVLVSMAPRLALSPELRRKLPAILALAAFVVATAMVARGAHQLAAVPWWPQALFASDVFQTGIALLWTAAACAAMAAGHRLARRSVWIAGAALLAVVVVKLLLVDLAESGALSRIVSFLGVGALVLVIGYFNPPPPREVQA